MIKDVVIVEDKDGKHLMPCSRERARILVKVKKKAVIVNKNPFTIRMKERELKDSELQNNQINFDSGGKGPEVADVRGERPQEAKTEERPEKDLKTDSKTDLRTYLKTGSKKVSNKDRKVSSPEVEPRYPFPPVTPEIIIKMAQERDEEMKSLPRDVQDHVDELVFSVKEMIKSFPATLLFLPKKLFEQNYAWHLGSSNEATQSEDKLPVSVNKDYVLERGGYACAYCGKDNRELEVDHVISLENGGKNDLSNLVPTCRECKRKKGKRTVEDFLKDEPDKLQ
ncbi:MAG: HNH endonuclease, partial [Deltaproteobacteria bacterium]|nr:HNH endonuclease [Deltaproteobacteria bacterium]